MSDLIDRLQSKLDGTEKHIAAATRYFAKEHYEAGKALLSNEEYLELYYYDDDFREKIEASPYAKEFERASAKETYADAKTFFDKVRAATAYPFLLTRDAKRFAADILIADFKTEQHLP